MFLCIYLLQVASVHRHYSTESHAAELTAGFNNTLGTPGYGSIMEILKKNSALLNFTSVELSTAEQPAACVEANSDPQALVRREEHQTTQHHGPKPSAPHTPPAKLLAEL